MDAKRPTDDELKEFLLDKYIEEKLQDHADHIKASYNKNLNRSIERYKKKLAKVTPKLFFAFLTEKGFSAKCVSCGSSNLSVPESGTLNSEKLPENFSTLDDETKRSIMDEAMSSHVSYTSFEEKPNGIVGLSKSYYKMHCLNCGHLSLYRTSTVLKWLEDKEGNNE
ncbi:hypothetical protein AB7W67_07830 [Providencia rettgeri]